MRATEEGSGGGVHLQGELWVVHCGNWLALGGQAARPQMSEHQTQRIKDMVNRYVGRCLSCGPEGKGTRVGGTGGSTKFVGG